MESRIIYLILVLFFSSCDFVKTNQVKSNNKDLIQVMKNKNLRLDVLFKGCNELNTLAIKKDCKRRIQINPSGVYDIDCHIIPQRTHYTLSIIINEHGIIYDETGQMLFSQLVENLDTILNMEKKEDKIIIALFLDKDADCDAWKQFFKISDVLMDFISRRDKTDKCIANLYFKIDTEKYGISR